jgi:hypothetical protein
MPSDEAQDGKGAAAGILDGAARILGKRPTALAVLGLVVTAAMLGLWTVTPQMDGPLAFATFLVAGVVLMAAMAVILAIVRREAAPPKPLPVVWPPKDTIEQALEASCRAASLPRYPGDVGLRAFLFVLQGNELVCKAGWAERQHREVGSVSFRVDDRDEDAPVVVRAFRAGGAVFDPAPPSVKGRKGVKGAVHEEIKAILAAPIRGPDGALIGTIDFDAVAPAGTGVLATSEAKVAILALARHFGTLVKPAPDGLPVTAGGQPVGILHEKPEPS